jgi:hypothetical protein
MAEKCLDNGNMTDSAHVGGHAGLRFGGQCIGEF